MHLKFLKLKIKYYKKESREGSLIFTHTGYCNFRCKKYNYIFFGVKYVLHLKTE